MKFAMSYTSKDSLFLELLPAEIRSIIYSIVLAPTGRITIQNNDSCESDQPPLTLYPSVWPHPTIDLRLLSITRTCRQIYKESRGLFWQINTLVLTTEHLCNPLFVNGLFTSWRQLRRVELQFGLSVEDIESVLWILHPLDALSRRGKLQEVLFSIRGMGTMSNFGEALIPHLADKNVTKMTDLYDMLRAASDRKDGRLAHVKRGLDLQMGMYHLSSKARKEWFRQYSVKRCEDAFEEMHTLLRGDVRMDGILCYRDGARMKESFRKLAEESVDEEGVDDPAEIP